MKFYLEILKKKLETNTINNKASKQAKTKYDSLVLQEEKDDLNNKKQYKNIKL